MPVAPARRRAFGAALPLAALLAAPAAPIGAQTVPAAPTAPKVHHACYVASTGTVYRIKEPGLPTACGTTRKVADVAFSWTDAVGADHGALQGLTDDDHPQYLLAGGSRAAPNGFAATGTLDTGTLLASGAGTRLVWYPGRAAFRAGVVNATQWDAVNIGNYSVALGTNTTARGNAATALGDGSIASGYASTALGEGSRASGNASTATGEGTRASGNAATAMGINTTASGTATAALGFHTTASGSHSTALGFYTTASGAYSTALGNSASTNGQPGSFVYGDNSTSASVTAGVANEFVVRATGGFRFRTDEDLLTGCNIAGGNLTCTGTVAGSSSRLLKHDFQPVDAEAVLARVAALDVRSWRYTADSAADVRHLGPVAEEFRAAFGLGANATTISMVDADGVNMLAIQALEARDRARRAELAALRAENAALQTRLARLEAALAHP